MKYICFSAGILFFSFLNVFTQNSDSLTIYSTVQADSLHKQDSVKLISDSTLSLKDSIPSEIKDSLKIDSLYVKSDTSLLKNDTISIIGVGDMMLGTDYPSKNYLPPGRDCSLQLKNVQTVLKDADITFGNFEGTMAGDKGIPKYCRDTTRCYVFRMPQEFIHCFTESGFDVLSTANNHSNDFGEKGRLETMRILDTSGIHYAGYLEKSYIIFVKDSVQYGFCAFAPNKGTMDSKNYDTVISIISYLDSLCDIVITSIHSGAEGAKYQHLPKTDEVYLGYNRGNIYEFSHLAVDAGADIIFGHGPHVTRAIELYKNRFIAYSLGNFSTYGRFNLRGPNGIAPIIKINVDINGQFINGQIIPTYQEGEGYTQIDPQKRAIYKIIELTKIDFSDPGLNIDTNGKITKKQALYK